MTWNRVGKWAVAFLCFVLTGGLATAFGAVRHTRRHYVRRVLRPYDPARDDISTYDDPVIRQLALDALGHNRGSVVAVDPNTGRVLAVVNQPLAFSTGFEPCSTTKPIIAVAGLKEGAITPDTMLRIGYRRYMDLTEALAHSNNQFFEDVGAKLGFDTVIKYEKLFGLGQRTSLDIPEEQPGSLPTRPPIWGGVAKMSSFGEGIRITPFQLALVISTLANGGTEYWLQYPRTQQENVSFTPRVRRQLDIASLLPDLREGLLAAVLYGTARRSFDPADGEEEFGKTGTCNDERVGGRLGWFVSFADQTHPKIVLVVLLHGGGRIISGPYASEIAGRIYHGLYEHNYFAETPSAAASEPVTTAAIAPALR